MSGFELPTKAQLIESCNQVESVLDVLHDHTDTTLTNRTKIISLVKGLFTSLQRLEQDESTADGAFHTANVRAKHNLGGILTGCGVVAYRLRQRITANALRQEDGLGLELMSLTNEIEDFLKLRKKTASTTMRPKPGTSSDSSALVEDLLRKQQKHASEVDGLEVELTKLYQQERAFEQKIATLGHDLAAKDELIAELQNHNDAKLSHIRRLHAAISNLGLRHPMKHQTHDWDDLTDEFPAMLDRVKGINNKLKELELERDQLREQEHDPEEDTIATGAPSAPKLPSAVNGSKPSTKDKDKDHDAKKKKEHRRSSDGKQPSKVRSPSPTSSETSKANTSKSVRRKSRHVGNGSGFFFST